MYLNLILFENLLMNYIILFATGIVLKIKMKNYRLFISSFIGSIYAIALYININYIISNILMKFLLSISMVWIAFQAKIFKSLLKEIITFYGISFLFGGCAIALIYLINPANVKIKDGVLVGLYPIKILIIAGAVAFLTIQFIFKLNKNKLTIKDMICNLHINIEGKVIKIKAFIDSGNMLKDPISGYPVIIISKSVAYKHLSKNIINTIEHIKGGEFDLCSDLTKIRIIPFNSLGNSNGMIVGIKAKEIEIIYGDKVLNEKNVIVGISEQEIGIKNKYKALIGLNVIEGSVEDEFTTNTKVSN